MAKLKKKERSLKLSLIKTPLCAALLLGALSLSASPARASAVSVTSSSINFEFLEQGEKIFNRIGTVLNIAGRLVDLYKTYQSINFSDEALFSRFGPYFNAKAALDSNDTKSCTNCRSRFLNETMECQFYESFDQDDLSFTYFAESDAVFSRNRIKSIDRINLVIQSYNNFFFDYRVVLIYKLYQDYKYHFNENQEICMSLKDYKVSKINRLAKDEATVLIYEDIESKQRLSIDEERCYPVKVLPEEQIFIVTRSNDPIAYCWPKRAEGMP